MTLHGQVFLAGQHTIRHVLIQAVQKVLAAGLLLLYLGDLAVKGAPLLT